MYIKICLICKKEFKIRNYRIDTAKYCSMVCYGKAQQRLVGESHYNWKGDNIGYYGIHVWIKRTYGNAIKCENSNCLNSSIKFEWALIKGKKYERKIENFFQLCKKCHVNYDMNDKWRRNNSLSKIGKTPWNKGKKGLQIAWNKGLKIKI